MTDRLLDQLPRKTIIVLAAPAEARAAARGFGLGDDGHAISPWTLHPVRPSLDLLVTGVGKAAAAGAIARVLDAKQHARVLNLGVAGALGIGPARIGDVVVATDSVFADEGITTPDGFQTLDEMGFGPPIRRGQEQAGRSSFREMFRDLADHEGVIATVSTCSGTDECAACVQERTGAIAEAMEGAAIDTACRWLSDLGASDGPIFAEVRVISNTTGNRDAQQWDLPRALDQLALICESL